MSCECSRCKEAGLDELEGEDEVTQALVEEAVWIIFEAAQAEFAEEGEPEPERKPGEITDPAVQDALDRARQLHEQTHGVRV